MKHASATINDSNYLYSVQTCRCILSHINNLKKWGVFFLGENYPVVYKIIY